MNKDRERERGKILWARYDCADLFELKKELLKLDLVEFKAVSWCMFPVVQRGDTIRVEDARVSDIRAGDIPVYRAGGKLYSHRVIGKKIVDGREYMVTRPDAGAPAGDETCVELVPGEELLGRVREVKRGRDVLPTARRSPDARDMFFYKKAAILSGIRSFISKYLIIILDKVQASGVYAIIAKSTAGRLRRSLNFQIVTPAKNRMAIYSHRPVEKVDIDELEEFDIFYLLMKHGSIPIGYAAVVNKRMARPGADIFPDGLYIRRRYRGMGLEDSLKKKAGEIVPSI